MKNNLPIKPSVSVVMSSYNGEAYIKEQLDSIFNQVDVDIHLVVRDDGSTDNTIQILEEYASCRPMKLIKGENVGFRESFMLGLLSCDKTDYYAFADQDDVWSPQKLIRTIRKMGINDIPKLGFCNAYLTDENLNVYRYVYSDSYYIPSKEMCFSSCVASGYLQVFNYLLFKIILKANYNIPVDHDIWIGALAIYFGKVYFYNEKLVYHRRLKNSVSRCTLMGRLKNRLQALIYDRGINIDCANKMLQIYGADLKKEDIIYLMKVSKYRENIKYKMELLKNKNIKYDKKHISVTPKIKVLLNRF